MEAVKGGIHSQSFDSRIVGVCRSVGRRASSDFFLALLQFLWVARRDLILLEI